MAEPDPPPAPLTTQAGDEVDWALASFEGARREQLRRWGRLPLRDVVLALERMQALAVRLGNAEALPGVPEWFSRADP